jgi:hypothetical protein
MIAGSRVLPKPVRLEFLTKAWTDRSMRSKQMLWKNSLADNLGRELDRARGKRDALASDVTKLTAQIAELETRLSEQNDRRERERVVGEIEGMKKRLKDTAKTFAPVLGGLCDATQTAAAVVPEARELNSYLLAVGTEVDTVIDLLLHELERQAEAVRAGQAAPNLPQPANAAKTLKNNDRLLRFPTWLRRNEEEKKKDTDRRSAAA